MESFLFLGMRKALIFLGCCGFFITFLALSPYTNTSIELGFQDLLLRWIAGNTVPHPGILVVGIDGDSLSRVPQRWPWSRAMFGRLLETISRAGPRFVLVDILFSHPDQSDGGEGDRFLRDTLTRFPRIGLVSLVEESETANGFTIKEHRTFPDIRKQAGMEGFAHSVIDADGKVRSFVFLDHRREKKSLVLQVAQLLSSATAGIRPACRDSEQAFVALPSPDAPFPAVSAADVLDGRVATETFQGKIVVLGATAESLHDYHLTYLGVTSGPEILAATLDTLLKGTVRRQKAGLLWRMASFGVALLLIFLLFSFSKGEVLMKGLLIWVGAFLGCAVLCRSGHVYVPFAPFSWSFLLCLFGMFCLESMVNAAQIRAAKVEGLAAGAVQKELFPASVINEGEYLVRAVNIPCEEVGGDFFDFQVIDGRNLFFILGDVSGHGVPAALVTVMAKTAIEVLRQAQIFSVESFLKSFNQLTIRLLKKKRMMTAILGTLDLNTHELKIHHAGHLFPVLVSQDGTIREVKGISCPLGVSRKTVFPEIELVIQPGESLVIYTDGIVEATNWNRKEYSFERWYDNLSRVVPGLVATDDLYPLLEGVRKHAEGRPFADDVTMLVITRKRADPG
jgi:CHASE2 domain-containing sensor protein